MADGRSSTQMARFHYRVFAPKEPITESLNSIAWTPDSQGFYAQDLDTLYHYALDVSTLKDKAQPHEISFRAPDSAAGPAYLRWRRDGHTLLRGRGMG